MNVVVCTKQTPSTSAVFSVSEGQVSWGDPTGGKLTLMNPWDEYAVEEALRLKENHGATEITALTLGAETAQDALKTSLAMGCNRAVLVSDAAFEGVSGQSTARILAAAILKTGAEIALFGKQAIDGDTGMTPMMTARALGWTALTYVSAIKSLEGGTITVERLLEQGTQTVTAQLPVVISVVKEINEPRYPSFMGIRKANRAKIPVWNSADLSPTTSPPKVDWSNIYAPPERVNKTEFLEGDATEIAQQLADRLFAEKVI